jgi:gamma-glutamylputrescine oxidase
MAPPHQHSPSSFWERSTFLSPQDCLIIGSGIVGISTALAIKRTAPNAKVTILERGCLPCGASSKNAGFACFGSISELLMHEKQEGTAAMLEVVKMRYDGLQLLLKNVAADEIEYAACGNYETFTAEQSNLYEECVAQRERLNLELNKLLGEKEVFANADKDISTFGLGEIKHLFFNRAEGRLHSGRLLAVLQRKAQQQGIQILTGFEVKDFSEDLSGVRVCSTSGHSISGAIAVLATNAFTTKLLPELADEIKPGRGQVLVTKPIKDLKLDSCFHYDHGYFYFRRIEDRVLLGGGRNLDFGGESTTDFDITSQIQTALDTLLREVILPYTEYEVDYRWSGIMCFGPECRPIIRKIRARVIAAVRMSGMGVAIGSLVAEQAAKLALENL